MNEEIEKLRKYVEENKDNLKVSEDLIDNTIRALKAECPDLEDFAEGFSELIVKISLLISQDVIVLDKSINDSLPGLFCTEITELIEGLFSKEQNKSLSSEESLDSENHIQYNIFKHFRIDYEYKQYISNKGYEADIHTLFTLFEVVKNQNSLSDFNEDVIRDIKSGVILQVKDQHTTIVDRICEIFRLIYKETFSLYPYKAVIAFGGVIQKPDSITGSIVSRTQSAYVIKRDDNEYYTPALLNQKIATTAGYYDTMAKELKDVIGNITPYAVNLGF